MVPQPPNPSVQVCCVQSPALSPARGLFLQARARITALVALFWLAYQTKDGVCVVLQEAPSLVHARMRTALAGLDGGFEFREGHELDAKTAKKVPKASIGKCLSPKQAAALLKRLSA